MLIKNLRIRTVPTGIFKHLFNQRTVSSARIPVATPLNNEIKAQKFLSPDVLEGTLLLRRYPHPCPIPWEEVSHSLAQKNEDVQNAIIKSCMQLKDPDALMSYYTHVNIKGGNFSEINLFLIVKMLSGCSPTKILQYEKLVIELYYKCKEFLLTSPVFQLLGVEVFPYVPHCFRELASIALRGPSLLKKDHLTARAFDFDDPAVAWELLNSLDRNLTEGVLKAFANYCIRQAFRDKFPVDCLQRLVDACQDRGLILEASDITCSLQPLVSVLSHCDKEHVWSLRKSRVNSQMECLNCNTTLKDMDLSWEDFERLKEAVFKALLPEDVFLKSTSAELHRFKKFLNTCEPFDFVVDGLNFLYRGLMQGKQQKLLPVTLQKFVKERRKKVLIISRKHFSQKHHLATFPGAQIFFTDNSSDDDLFIIWAAMHGGLGTGVLTCDFLNTHSSKLDPKSKLLFIKWQMSHQYIIDAKFGVILPRKHLGLSQGTEFLEAGGKSYRWHLSYQEADHTPYSFRLSSNWLCLQRTPRKSTATSVS